MAMAGQYTRASIFVIQRRTDLVDLAPVRLGQGAVDLAVEGGELLHHALAELLPPHCR